MLHRLASSVRKGFHDLRIGLLAVGAAAAMAAPQVLANDLQDASRLLKAGQPQQALDRVNKLLASRPKDAQARFLKGLILTDQGNSREAIEIFQRLTQDFPELPEPYNNLAVLYAAQGQYDRARAALEQSIRTHPSYATAYENLGDVYAKLASQAYGKALQLDAGNAAAQNKLALVRDLVADPPPTVVAQAPKEPAKPAASVPPKPAPPVEKAPEKAAPAEKPAAVERPATAEKPAPALEKPAAAPPEKPAPSAAADASGDIIKALDGWAQAWSRKDADAYLAFYAADFRTPKGEPRAQWEKDRRLRIAAPKSIAVTVASPKVTMSGPAEASVTFRQTYASDVLKSSTTKTLVFVRQGNRWLIRQEKTG